VDIGVGATKVLSQASVSELDRITFRMQCIDFLAATVPNVIERSSLKHGIVRSISCLVPGTVANNQTLADRRMTDLVQTLYDANRISALRADKAKSQFAALMIDVKEGKFREHFASFDRSKDQLDSFYHQMIGGILEYADLFAVIRVVLILSHGNAAVESGFSVNNDFLVENLHEESLVAQRRVCDAVKASGGVTSVNITKSLLQYVRGSNARNKDALEVKKKEAGEEIKRAAEKSELSQKYQL